MLEQTKEAKRSKEEAEYIKEKVLRKFPLLGVTMSHLKVAAISNLRTLDGKRMDTATTNGETIYYHPEFFASLSLEEKIFVLAHEVMHAACNHVARSKDKDQVLWGIATDSVINQILKSEGLLLVKGSIDREDAINCSAEEMYEKLVKEEEDNKRKEIRSDWIVNYSNEQDAERGKHDIWRDVVSQLEDKSSVGSEKEEEDSDNSVDGDEGDENEQANSAGHKIKQRQKQEQKQQTFNDREKQQIGGETRGAYQNEQQQDGDVSPRSDSDFERSFVTENRKEREVRAKEIKNALNRQKNKVMAKMAQEGGVSLGNIGTSEAVLDWKNVLKKSLEDERFRWSYRRANADNDHMPRVEELEDEELAETEVMLDVSGSVDVELLKEFLRQLKPILKTSKLKVGCFDEYFYGLSEVRKNADIDNFKIISKSKWTENWNLAVKSFSKRKDVNKIVFTDGYPAPGTMPDESTRNINVIWIVYGNKSFNPICGKVIHVDLS